MIKNYLPYIIKITENLERVQYKGYDPYDALNIPLPWSKMGRILPALLIQIIKRLPINIRPILGIRKGHNPKAMGLFLHAFCILYKKTGNKEYLKKAHFFFEWLLKNSSRGYAGLSWGYNFPWKSPIRDLPAFTPSAVATAFVCRGIMAYYNITKNIQAAKAINAAANFIIKELPRFEDQSGISISYTPLQTEICYNASLLAAEILVYANSIELNNQYQEIAKRCANFVLTRQNPDGSWNYSEHAKTGQVRQQIDFHQGYILESLHILQKYLGIFNPDIKEIIYKGMRFYHARQFFPNGRPLYRLPKPYPTDIHHVAQGIITFSRIAEPNGNKEFSDTIANWSLQHMLSSKGYFYYRKYAFFKNRINYIRWAQAWMLLALAEKL